MWWTEQREMKRKLKEWTLILIYSIWMTRNRTSHLCARCL